MISAAILGFLAGIAFTMVAVVITVKCICKHEDREDFVLKLIAEKGWFEARNVLQLGYKRVYMRIWKKLYRNHMDKSL